MDDRTETFVYALTYADDPTPFAYYLHEDAVVELTPGRSPINALDFFVNRSQKSGKQVLKLRNMAETQRLLISTNRDIAIIEVVNEHSANTLGLVVSAAEMERLKLLSRLAAG